MSNLSDLFTAVYNKLLTNSYSSPVSLTESIDIIQDMNDVEHRLELSLLSADADSYQSQREIPWEVYLFIVGYRKITNTSGKNSWTIDDHTAILDFGSNIVNSVFSLLDDKQQGLVTIPGFLYFNGKARLIVDMELVPGISTFAAQITAVVQQNDTNM